MDITRQKVVLIEDDHTMGDLLETLLGLEGFQVILHREVWDTGQLIHSVSLEKPAIVMLDVHLRQINGLELLDLLRREEGLKETKFILSSGIDYREDSIKAGADAFILKPYMPDELIGEINILLGDEHG